jgi:Leucine-rich repeat (LRR) protein
MSVLNYHHVQMKYFPPMMLLLLLGCAWLAVAEDDCPYKECSCQDDETISCASKGLTSLPELTAFTTQLTVLDLTSNNITHIPEGRLPPNLTEINFSENPITTIDISAFVGSLDSLATVSFSSALFTRIPDALHHLRALQSLTICDTFIQDWNEDGLKIIALTLETLQLINVTLHTWPTWIQYFTHLTELSLDSNFISSIPDNAFDAQANSLNILILVRNNLTEVPKALSQLTLLLSLDLGYNRISNLTFLPQSKQLGRLSLMYNRLSNARHISDLLRPLADVLSDVDLFGNQLTEIPDLSFMTNVGYLDLTNNHISTALPGALSGEVTDVDLDDNLLSSIPIMFLKLPHINTIALSSNQVRQFRDADIPVWTEEIDLDYNLVTELTDTSFPENSKLNILNLEGNPLVTISNLAFQNVEHLTVLTLKGTKLTRLPLGLPSLRDLNVIDVTDCSDLVCTCMEKSLSSWILNRELPMEGTCGETSIDYFFNVLSPECPN